MVNDRKSLAQAVGPPCRGILFISLAICDIAPLSYGEQLIWKAAVPHACGQLHVENAVTLRYYGDDGSLSVIGGGTPLTTIELRSASAQLLSDNAAFNCEAFPNVCRPDKVFSLETGGVGNGPGGYDLGPILRAGDVISRLIADLGIAGSFLGGGDLLSRGGGGPYIGWPTEHCWPEDFGDYDASQELDASDLDTMTVGMRENNSAFDLDFDGDADFEDRQLWVHNFKRTWFGDADLNGEFNSSDFVQVFVAGTYETGEYASWSDGDWSGDGLFNSSDFVIAFIDGGYEQGEQGPQPDAAAVPEPNAALQLILGVLCVVRRRSTS